MRSPLHGLEAIARELADFADGVEAQVGDLMFFASLEKRVGNGHPEAGGQGRAQPGGANP